MKRPIALVQLNAALERCLVIRESTAERGDAYAQFPPLLGNLHFIPRAYLQEISRQQFSEI